MARSFNVLYRFSAKDGFSKVSQKIRSGNKKLGSSFTGMTEKIRRGNRRLRISLKRLSRRLKKTNREFTFSGKSSKKLRDNLKGLAIAAAAFFGLKKLITTGAEFETALADLSAITGAVGKDLDKLKNKTLEMARASVTSQKDVAEGIKLVASAKPDLLKNIDALTATTEAVLLLKNAAGIELADAANITAQGLNIFGAEASRANEFVNILAAGAKLGSSEIADTGQAMLLAGPAARAAGLSFVQLNAAIQATALGGIKGSQAGTALNAILGRLRRQGIDFKKMGLAGAFEAVKKALDKTTNSTERAKLEAKIFGEEHGKVGLALINNRHLLSQFETTLSGTNIAQEQANIRLSTFSKGVARAGILMDEKLIKIFDKAKFGITALSTSISDFVEGLDPADLEVFGMVLSGLGVVASGLAVVIDTAFTGIMAVLKPVFAVLKGIGKLIGQVVGAMATMDFSKFDLSGAFDIGGKFLGLFGGEDKAALDVNTGDVTGGTPATVGTPIGKDSRSTTDINVGITAPEGVVKSVQSRTKGRTANVGVNMAAG